MRDTTSGNAESVENGKSDVTIIETVTVCTIDRRKGSNQKPQCTIKRVRVLNNTSMKEDFDPMHTNENSTPDQEGNLPESAEMKNEMVCPRPSKKMSEDEEEAARIDCLAKAYDKEVGGIPDRDRRKPNNNKGFKPRTSYLPPDERL